MYPSTHNNSSFRRLLAILAVLMGLIQPMAAQALDSDRYQPIDVSADSAVLDDKAGKATYRGNVLLTQGTLKIEADQLTIEAGAEGKVEKVIATGDLAYFEQIPNPDDKPIEARANTVEYYVAREKVILIENARVVQNDNLFEGNIIEYDIRDQKLQARGKTLTAEDSENQEASGRVKMVLQPQTETSDTPTDTTDAETTPDETTTPAPTAPSTTDKPTQPDE